MSVVSTSTPVALTGPERRRQSSLGGLVPTSAVARGGDTVILALCVEVHAEGAVLPLLVLSDAPGLLGWDPAEGLEVRDDTGREYEVESLAQQAGLGALQTAVWISPAPPPEARRLRLAVSGLVRTAVARSAGVERPLAGATWTLEIDLVPERTAVAVPEEPPGARAGRRRRPACRRAPSRASATCVPIGQARMADGVAVCLWSLERYADRSVLSVGHAGGGAPARGARSPRASAGWTSGTTAGAATTCRRSTARRGPGGARPASRCRPAIDPEARALGRAARRPARPRRRAAQVLVGPFTFGVAVPPSP